MASPKLLKPSFKLTQKGKSEYEQYEDDFSEYKSKSRNKLEQWAFSQNKVMPAFKTLQVKNSPKSQNQGSKNIMNAPKSSRIVNNSKEKSEISQSYGYKITKEFDLTESKDKTNEELQKQLKSMRQLLVQLNDMVTTKLSKYELAYFEPKGMIISNQPQKDSQILAMKIQTNARIIQSLEKQIKQIQNKDKELQQKDYLIQLQENTNSILKSIKQKRKETIKSQVTVEKGDQKLKELRDAALDDQFRMVKVIKHNILFYFKKLHENRTILEDLDKNYKDLIEKDQKTTQKYTKLAKMAEDKNMLVKSNKHYIQNKKANDLLHEKLEQAKKKIQIHKRSHQVQTEKCEKQIEKIKKQLTNIQTKSLEAQAKSHQLANLTQEFIHKNNIAQKMINSISYKFAEILLKDNNTRNSQIIQGFSALKQEKEGERKILSKPKLKAKLDKTQIERPANATARYHSQQSEEIQKIQQKVNDKNVETINFQLNKSKQFRIKPNLHIKKKSELDKKTLDNSQIIQNETPKKSESPEIIYKPSRFQKILSLRKNKDII